MAAFFSIGLGIGRIEGTVAIENSLSHNKTAQTIVITNKKPIFAMANNYPHLI